MKHEKFVTLLPDPNADAGIIRLSLQELINETSRHSVTIKLNRVWGTIVAMVSESFLANIEAQCSDLKVRFENVAERLHL